MKRVLKVIGISIGGLALLIYGLLAAVYLWGGYDTGECSRLKGMINDEDLRDELIRWVDIDLERALQDWEQKGPFHDLAGWPGGSYFSEHDFDLSLLGFSPEVVTNLPKVRLVTLNPLAPHIARGIVHPDKGLEFLLSITHSIAFTQVSRVALLVRMRGAEDFGVNMDYIRKVDGRLAVYCEPRD